MWLTCRSTFYRNLLTMYRAYPWTFFIGHILAGVYTVLFAYLSYNFLFLGELDSSFAGYAGTADYISYVALGGAMYAFAVSVLMIVSRSLITELREGTLESLLLTPSSRKGYFLGVAAQGVMRAGLELIAILIFGAFFGLNLSQINVPATVLTLMIALFAFFCQALVLGSFMLYFRDTYITQNTLFVIMAFVSGVTFPVQYLPDWLTPLSQIMPLTFALRAFRRSAIEGQEIIASSTDLVSLLILSLVYLAIGSLAIKKNETRVLEKVFD